MRIFVSGIAGFLGSHIAERFLKEGHDVVGVDNLIGGYLDNVPEGAEFYQLDLRDYDALHKVMAGVDLVYHTACTAYEGLSVFSPKLVVENTTQISVNLFTAAIAAKTVKRFVHCSSMARYGAQDTYPFTEEMQCKPQDPYGIAKYAAELILKNLSEVHGLDLVIAIPHNIIGPRQKYDDPYRNVASIMINLMLQKRQPVIYGDGSQVRCFSDIDDDLDCLLKFAFESKAVGNIYNIGPDEEAITILELSQIIARQLSFDLDPIFMPGRPQEVKYATCSANRIRKEFGYSTKVSLETSISKMIQYIESRGVKKFHYHLPIEIDSELVPLTWKNRLF